MTALTDFYDYVMPDLPNVGKDLALQAIREACVDFCENSLVWTYEIPAINVVGLTHTYALTPEANARIVDLLEVWYNGVLLIPAAPAELDVLYTTWRTSAGTGVPVYYFSELNRASVRLVKTPSDSLTGGLVVTVAQAPLAAATTVPDVIFERYRQAIAFGAKARLYGMPKRPWSDKALADTNGNRFDQACGTANISKTKSHTRKRLRTTVNFR